MYNFTLFLVGCLFYALVSVACATIVFLRMPSAGSTKVGLISGFVSPFLVVFTWISIIALEEGSLDATSVIGMIFVYGFLGLVVTCPVALLIARTLSHRETHSSKCDEDAH